MNIIVPDSLSVQGTIKMRRKPSTEESSPTSSQFRTRTFVFSNDENGSSVQPQEETPGDRDERLRQIIKTACQFTRHSHREELAMKDLRDAFKVHHVPADICAYLDKSNSDSLTSEDESEPFTISGKRLKKP